MLASIGVGLADEDLGGADGAADQNHERTDRSGASDQHRAAAGHPGAIDAVERHGGRFDERALLVGDIVGNQIGVVVVDDREFAHAAPGPAQSDATHAWAQMVEAAAAVIVVERHDERLDRDSVAFADPSHIAADVDNLGGELMAQNLRQHRAGKFVPRRRRDDRTAGEFVQVRAADAAGSRLDQHLRVAKRAGRRDVFHAYVLLGVEPHRFHGFSSQLPRMQAPSHRASADLAPASCRKGAGRKSRAWRERVSCSWMWRKRRSLSRRET